MTGAQNLINHEKKSSKKKGAQDKIEYFIFQKDQLLLQVQSFIIKF